MRGLASRRHSATSDDVTAPRLPLEHREISVDGVRYHVDLAGSGQPLLLLHGFTGSTASWDSVRGELAARHATIAVDLPGHGRSDAPDDVARYRLDRFADDLAQMLDQLGFRRVAVLGYSLGGRAALRFALRHPSRVAALVLESTSPGITADAERAARQVTDAELADSIERDGIETFVARWEQLPLWASQASLPSGTRERLRAQRLTNDPKGLANSLRGAGAGVDPPVLDRLRTMTTPTFVVTGLLDQKYVSLGVRIAAAAPLTRISSWPSQHIAFEGAGHAVHLEQPAAFAAAVIGFLDAVAADAPW